MVAETSITHAPRLVSLPVCRDSPSGALGEMDYNEVEQTLARCTTAYGGLMDFLPAQWLASVFSHPDLPGVAAIAAKTGVVYLFLLVGLRLLGQRELGQMSIDDLILIVVIANAVQNAMVGDDTSLGGGL